MYDIPILMLHTVNSQKDRSPMGVLSVSPEGLDAYLKVLQQWHYQMISMTDLLDEKYEKNKNFVVLTFDDGFKDNLTVAKPILEKYHAHATIFVNPDYVSEISDPNSDWGFMTWEEILEAEHSGVFDIQAHTMTHEFIFISDKIVDYYTPEKFDQYYWLAWMLFPDSPRKWNSDAYEYRDKIPTGYPVFEFGRRIAHRKFIPDKKYVTHCIDNFGKNNTPYQGIYGEYESESDYRKYIEWEIQECKRVLEKRLGKVITTLCFPGGGYTDYALEIAEKCGYKCHMVASRMREGKNYDHLERIQMGEFDGFNRTAFSLLHPGFLPDAFFFFFFAKLSLGAYQNIPRYLLAKKLLSKLWHT